MMPETIENSRNDKEAVIVPLQSSVQLRVGLSGTEIRVLHYPGARVASGIEAGHPRVRENALGTHTGNEGCDASTSRD